MTLISLLACGPGNPSVTTISGLQVVAIEAIPAEPSPAEPLTLRTWVADGRGQGADVLVWSCAPVDGACLEAALPELPPGLTSDGVPLSLWTRVGRAAPSFETEVGWPFLASFAADLAGLDDPPPGFAPFGTEPTEDEAPALLVWALACAPGVCPIVDAVRANPVPGSDAWLDVTAALADPAALLADVPEGDASIAVKTVPLYPEPDPYAETYGYFYPGYGDLDPPNEAPTLAFVEEAGATDPARLTRFLFWDVDDQDSPSARAFTTRGLVETETVGEGDLYVRWTPPATPGPVDPTLFVVLDDGRGGTAVWSSSTEGPQPCAKAPAVLPRDRNGGRLDPGEGVEIQYVNGGTAGWVDLGVRLEGFPGPFGARVDLFSLLDGRRLGSEVVGSMPWDDATCAGEATMSISIPRQTGALFGMDAFCALAGEPVEVSVQAGSATATVPVVLTISPYAPCTL